MSRLLVMSCSQCKRAGPARAVDLYDGPAYKVLRKSRAELPVVVLSAEHGLVAASDVLAYYDRKMDEPRAREFCTDKRAKKAAKLVRRVAGKPDEIFCYGGALYRMVVRHYASCGAFGSRPRITYSEGKIGEQLHQLKEFLDADRRPRASLWGRR